jgi:cyanide hydratase
MTFPKPVKVAVPQLEPAWLDKEAGLTKTVSTIEEAAANGAQLIAFSELWIPGYPDFLWANSYKDSIPLIRQYHENSIEIDSDDFARVRQAAKSNSIHVLFCFSERSNGSLFMAQSLISPTGEILLHRHKTKPTYVERTLFGDGTGDSIKNVVKTELGNIGTLLCWEHLQPLLKYHTYSQHEHFHIAAWPLSQDYAGWEHWSLSNDAGTIASRAYAMESGAFTLVATQCRTKSSIEQLANGSEAPMIQVGGGFSAIYGPDGKKLTRDIPQDWEGILYATCDFEQIQFAKWLFDSVGHYSRPDLFQLHADTSRKENVVDPNTAEDRSSMLYKFAGLGLDEGNAAVGNAAAEPS